MATRNLYLYEVVDVVGQGQYAYMEHLWKDPVLRMPEMFGLQGSFYVCAAGGGRWPQVINIWDIGTKGWKGWASNVDRMNLKRRKAFYGDWWDEAAQWRSGGYDRLCGGVPGSPSTEEIAARGIKGTLFVNEILTVRPGSALDFLAAVVEERVPFMRDHGHEPTGLYEVMSNQHEVVMVWATDIPSQVRLRQNRDTTRGLCDEGEVDDRIVVWERTAAGFVTGGDTHIMTPLPRTVYGPDDWEDASLEEWLDVTQLPERSLGALRVPAIGYGAMELAGAYAPADIGPGDDAADRALDAAVDAGCTFVDTSDSYGPSERQLGRFLAHRTRDDVCISTKFGLRVPDGEDVHTLHVPWATGAFRVNAEARLVRGYAEASLHQLGTDVIDLYSPHFPDPEVPIEETVGAVADLVAAGIVRHVGLSNPTAEHLRRAQTVHPIAAVQVQWSMWHPIEPALLARCTETGVGIVAWAPVGRGFLTGALTAVDGEHDFRRHVERLTGPNLAANNERFAPVRAIAADLGITPAQLALAWLLHQHGAVVPIPGSRTPAHIVENAAAACVELDGDALARIAAALATFVPAGDVS